MSKIITVFGATGNQGGSVINSLLADPAVAAEYKVRGVTRDVSKPASQRLADRGVEMVPVCVSPFLAEFVQQNAPPSSSPSSSAEDRFTDVESQADMGSADDTARAVAGAHTVFFVTNYWEHMSREKEVSQGKMVADACRKAHVQHIIFSSLIDVTKTSTGRLRHVDHFDGKADIEQYIREIGVPATFVMPGFFMSNFFGTMKKGDDGKFTYPLPVSGSKARIPMFDSGNDTGKFVKAAVKNFPKLVGQNILAATEYLSPDQVVSQFSEVMGKPASFQQITGDAYKSFLPAPAAQELLENMLLLENPGYFAGADLAESLALLDEKPTTWKEFVAANKGKWE